jgi:16S rRNA (cytosine1402-N4)-methyltransferase
MWVDSRGVVPFTHVSVLPEEVVAYLSPRQDGYYCDGTLGGGGHAARILATGARLLGIDRDPAALAAAGEKLAPFGDRVKLVHGTYAQLPELVGEGEADGLLLDLGVSSPQFDVAERGFSFSADGPLDMRMDPTRGQTAAELIESLSDDELADVLFTYGEERHSRRIARAIKEQQPATTAALARIVAQSMPAKDARERIHPATRTFQALRIAVNRELDELDAFLEAFPRLLKPGGRCVIISFHSLEDRRVKERFRDLEWTSRLPDDLAAQAGERTVPICKTLTRKPITASEAELSVNPRARSAKLRACEKV